MENNNIGFKEKLNLVSVIAQILPMKAIVEEMKKAADTYLADPSDKHLDDLRTPVNLFLTKIVINTEGAEKFKDDLTTIMEVKQAIPDAHEILSKTGPFGTDPSDK